MKLHEEKSSHQLAVELAELQRKHQIALGAIDRLQDQRDEAVAKAKTLAVKEGWKLVPMEPTKDMCEAGAIVPVKNRQSEAAWIGDIYRAMIAAAPNSEAES